MIGTRTIETSSTLPVFSCRCHDVKGTNLSDWLSALHAVRRRAAAFLRMQDARDLHVGELVGPLEGVQGAEVEARLVGRELFAVGLDLHAVRLVVQDVADQMQWLGHAMPPVLLNDVR